MSNAEGVAMDALGWLRQVAPSVFADRRDLHLDSRQLKPGDVFVALRGARVDGRQYLSDALAAGAAAALVDGDGISSSAQSTAGAFPILCVQGLRGALGFLAAEFYRRPSEHLLAIGVTGTNGKTSSTQWIAQLLTRAGRRCAVIGTIGIGFVDEALIETSLTTPDPVSLQREVRALLDAGAQALAMEVSSIGLEQGRLAGMKIDIALFTNLTRDHLDYHGTLQQYEAAKSLLFDWPTLSHAVINLDDAAGCRLIPRLTERGVDVIGYGTTDVADAESSQCVSQRIAHCITARSIRATSHGLAFEAELNGQAIAVEVPLIGRFNVENLLGVLGVMHACGIEFERAVAALPQLHPPPGRMQQVACLDAPLAVIDYAHTPDALAKALAALRPLVSARAIGGKLWVVFGAGGDRDAGKRALMGAVAAQGADVVVITSDNPRSESAEAIAAQVAAGAASARELITEIDRSRAIALAMANAAPSDIVLIAGKGHEAYQIIGAEKLPFSDLSQARAALARRVKGIECRH
ncbi:MAG TPA: UDP-N-acetylmuramoyl-L-alanyl-D-glutamate--2,6-diaminopimelate ligase [Burkholderiaceae bacterium]|nr:UDP-N-acetylmuramoyl-L-alanyl-D-glutamate--2,6-diaminopimelate ligase [Burkholderiaceae bacterium]